MSIEATEFTNTLDNDSQNWNKKNILTENRAIDKFKGGNFLESNRNS